MMDEPYENRMTVEQLRLEVRELWNRDAALARDLKSLPEVPSIETMWALSGAAKFSEDWDLGKQLQQKHPYGAVPSKNEMEMGAGFYTRIRNAILFAMRGAGGAATLDQVEVIVGQVTPVADNALVERLNFLKSQSASIFGPLINEAAARIKELTESLAEADSKNEALLAEWNTADERVTKAEGENVRLREALEAIIARGPERNVRWTGMTAKDIAIQALQQKEE